MSGTNALRRLLQVLELEEEQGRTALESAVAAQRWLEQRLSKAVDRSRCGRLLIAASAESGNLTDRWAGIEEVRSAAEHTIRLKPKIREAELIVAKRRQEYLAKRVERRQAETLIEEAEAREAIEADRRDQQGLDEWYLNRLARNKREQERRDRNTVSGATATDACGDASDEQSLRDANAKT